MKRWRAGAVLLSAMFIFQDNGALAQPDTWPPPWYSASRCTRQDSYRAEYEADALKSWAAVHQAFKRYGQCDDGAIAEGYSASIAALLAWHWPAVRELSELTRSDPMFERFVLYHVDDTLEMEQGKAIVANTRRHCPTGVEKLCRRLEKAATPGK